MPFQFGLADHRWFEVVLIVGAAVAAALLAHAASMFILRRVSMRTGSFADDILVGRLTQPARWLLVVIALAAVQPSLRLDPPVAGIVQRILGLLAPALLGWLVVALLRALNEIAAKRYDIDVADNLEARRRRTRAGILYRIAIFIVLLITICLMLMSIPSVRTIGVTMAASAGLAALAVGAAAQPALKNLIAGIQMAFTEPIRIDDVVIVEGEWGRIEEIRLTYVVVKIWDERRLIVPVSRFLENSFENWTRKDSELLGTVFLHLDPAADIGAVRAEFERVVKANANWDGRVCVLQVTDVTRDTLEVRGLVSAKDAGSAFELRCDAREKMMAFVARAMPAALPRRREQLAFEDADETAGVVRRIAGRR